jgi:hypothetical protein
MLQGALHKTTDNGLLTTDTSFMDFPIIVVVFGVLSIGVLFLLARRALKLVVRVALLGVLVLLAGGVAWWWYGAGSSSSPASKQNDNRPASTRRGTSR